MIEQNLELTKKDKMFLISQYKILSKLYPEEESHYLELIEILEKGYAIFYSQLERWIDDDMSVENGEFVLNVLDLYRAIEDVKRKSKNSSLIAHPHSYFHGFDGNNEAEYFSFAGFLINKQGKYSEQKDYLLKNDSLNSHAPMVWKYTKMLMKWNSINKPYMLTVEQAIEILNA
ncbi:YfbU family protein [Pectobacterium brasiliense]|uniref:YfbU family protein n=1 Tax=Pectobacterium brasiliense TaxID=180957 RepID=UPI003CEFAD5B